MPNSDATQYLLRLRNEINEAWFHYACDLALNSNGSSISEHSLNSLYQLFHRLEAYAPQAATSNIPNPPSEINGYFLESLKQFNGFKRLAPGFEVEFKKRITVIFGKNGSGKSSVCDAIKVLANPSGAESELRNVYTEQAPAPQFNYKFSSDNQEKHWNLSTGLGLENESIRYFDSTIAVKNVTDEAKPSNSVEVSLFRLEIFDYVRDITNNLNRYLVRELQSQAINIRNQIAQVKSTLQASVNIAVEPFFSWDAHSFHPVQKLIAELPEFNASSEQLLQQKQAELVSTETALTQSGQQVLQGQKAVLVQVGGQLADICNGLSSFQVDRIPVLASLLYQKDAALRELSNYQQPLVKLFTHAASLRNFESLIIGTDTCPLCESPVTQQSQALFKSYHNYLKSNIRTELSQLQQESLAINGAIQNILNIELADISACEGLIPQGFKDALETNLSRLKTLLLQIQNNDYQQLVTFNDFRMSFIRFKEQLNAAKAIVESSITQLNTNRGGLEQAKQRLTSEVAQMKANQCVHLNRAEISRVCELCAGYFPYYSRLGYYDFSSLLRKLSITGKLAYNELILSSYEDKLAEEYRKLTGITHVDRGIKIHTRSSEQVVYATPQIGGSKIARILSEGEQKVHSLAVFFCEASLNPQQVLVFDDPVTSFDYDHISNFCERLRDFASDNPNTQIIIFTHNWDFFASIQLVLKRRGNLHNELSIQVLENCSITAEYSEKWNELCAEIDVILQQQEPVSDSTKEQLSALLRRLMERLVNAFVFNEQRHQYKVKSLKVSEFSSFTKVVPLTDEEANRLRDLYANLSPTEHDDIRNHYTSRNLAEFRDWYLQLCNMKSALQQRRPN